MPPGSNLIATPASPASPDDAVVKADGFFSDIHVAEVRAKVRIGENIVTHERLVAAIEGAMLTGFRLLGAWRTAWVLAGKEAIGDIGTADINEKKPAEICWERIILNYSAAEIAELSLDISATDAGTLRGEEKMQSADHYRRHAHDAVTDMLSIGAGEIEGIAKVGRNTVELV